MAEARILINGNPIRVDEMSDFLYSKYGCLFGFKYKAITFRHCVDNSKGIKDGYYDYDKYLKYVSSNYKEIPKDFGRLVFDNLYAEPLDMVTVYRREVSDDFLKVCWYTYKFEHVEGVNYGVYENLKIPAGTKPADGITPDCTHDPVAGKFYDSFIQKAKLDDDREYAVLLADIQQLIEYIELQIFDKLSAKNVLFVEYINKQKELWSDGKTYDFPEKHNYTWYYTKLSTFTYAFESYKNKLGDDLPLIMIYLLSVMSSFAVEALPLDIKMTMLSKLAKRDMDNWQIFYNPQDDESIVVKIVKSVKSDQADLFLDAMLDTKYVLIDDLNLFDLFYDGLNDKNFGTGKENLKDFVLALYDVWKLSSNNPYQNGVFNEDNLKKFKYNRLLASNPDPANPFWLSIGVEERSFNFDAAPISINYTSAEIAGYYIDNFDFYFTKDFSSFYRDREDFEYKFRYYKNAKKSPFQKILAVEKNYTHSTGLLSPDGLYGTYDYYQPVSLANASQGTIIQIPVIDGKDKDTATIDGHPEKISSLVPIFLLKYIDDAGDKSDFLTTIGYLVDIISIVSGGYGLFEKLKYIKAIANFSPDIIAGTEVGSKIAYNLYEIVSDVTKGITLTGDSISLLFKLSGKKFEKESWYPTLINMLSWIEVFSGGGSVLSDKMLKASAGKLVADFISSGSWPEDFASDPRGPDAQKLLEDMSKNSDAAKDDLLEKAQIEVRQILPKLLAKDTKNKFSWNGADGKPLHTDQEISDIVKIAFDQGVPALEIAQLIHISYLKNKRIETPQLVLQVKYYANVTILKGYPAGFSSIEQYQNFCAGIRDFWIDTHKYLDNKYGVNLSSVKYDLRIQGSAVRTRKLIPTPDPSPTDPSTYDGLNQPGDIEYAILVDSDNYNTYVNEMQKLIDNEKITQTIRMNMINGMKSLKQDGSLKYDFFTNLIKDDISVLSGMRATCFQYTSFRSKEINFAVIKLDSRLELGPYVTFKYKL